MAGQSITKDEILSQLRKEGVTDLDGFADFVLRKAHQDGDLDKPIVLGVIIYTHGFVYH